MTASCLKYTETYDRHGALNHLKWGGQQMCDGFEDPLIKRESMIILSKQSSAKNIKYPSNLFVTQVKNHYTEVIYAKYALFNLISICRTSSRALALNSFRMAEELCPALAA